LGIIKVSINVSQQQQTHSGKVAHQRRQREMQITERNIMLCFADALLMLLFPEGAARELDLKNDS